METNQSTKNVYQYQNPVILNSISNDILSQALIEDQPPPLTSLTIRGDESININPNLPSFLLLDESEHLKVSSEADFLKKLKIVNSDDAPKVKVVSIFGSTGEGKSYTLNKAFFNGKEVFCTSADQTSCALGVWAAYDPYLRVIVLDTEGLLGITEKESQRTRLLLKVLAVSDIIIYRTRAERLQRDMYTFLSGASTAYKNHFEAAIQQICKKSDLEIPSNSLGPGVIIFHETLHTNTLQYSAGVTESAEDILRRSFSDLRLDFNAFSSLRYIGVQTKNGVTSFNELRKAIQLQLSDTKVRSCRSPKVIYRTLKGINEKFSNEIKSPLPHLYLIQYFTCQAKCQSCNEGCTLSMSHNDEGDPHSNNSRCKFQHQYQNCVYLCKQCNKNGERVVVKQQSTSDQSWTGLFNFVWSGYVIECKNCGEIYRSRQHWVGNKNPEDSAVIAEVVHVWPGERNFLGSQNSAQRMLDGVNTWSNAVASVAAQPTQAVTGWITDQVAPSYWRKNHEILECHLCKVQFGTSLSKHHCRECGEGFCKNCSSKKQPVPSRGWYDDVRVCDNCYKTVPPSLSQASDDTDVKPRKYSEAISNSLSVITSVLEIPKGIIKDSARPSYWTPDNECIKCHICANLFGTLIPLHHCRDCGKGVCDDCSNTKKPVPYRGWDDPVRVCDNCLKK